LLPNFISLSLGAKKSKAARGHARETVLPDFSNKPF
jgi:hypothetical protein